MGTSGKIFMPTPFSLEAQQCTPVLRTECRRRSPLLLLQPSRSRSLLLLRGSTLCGLEAPSSLHSQHSSRCGLQSKSMMNLALELYTGNASNEVLSSLLVSQLFKVDIPF